MVGQLAAYGWSVAPCGYPAWRRLFPTATAGIDVPEKDRTHKHAATHGRKQTHVFRFGLQGKDVMWCLENSAVKLGTGLN